MHPTVVAGCVLGAAILGATVGSRLLPQPAAGAAPAAQGCTGSIGYYSPGADEIAVHGSAFAAFQQEIVAKQTNQGARFNILDLEFDPSGQAFWYYDTVC
jgi:hypothetical protein